jgi:hypothetical protein
MSEEITEQHMHKLRELGEKHAKAKGQLSLLDHNRKILLSTLMKEKMISSNSGKLESVNAQEREARADQRYTDHIKALAIAIEKESELAWEKEIVRINFETWKTKMINQMKEYRNYGNKK